MSATDRIRTLADSGTPGPWELSKPSGDPWIEQVGPVGNTVLEPERVDCMSYCYGGSSRYNLSDADAAKIVAAVNMLPAVAALVEAVEADHEEHLCEFEGHVCSGCGNTWPCPTARALADLAAALGGES